MFKGQFSRIWLKPYTLIVLTGLLGIVLPIGVPRGAAGQPPAVLNHGGLKKPLKQILERGPRPADEVDSFIDSLSSNDATFKLPLNQGRLLTLKQDLLVVGKVSPLIAVGDPTVVAFEVVGLRHIRLTGLRIGITDLSVITGDNENYSFEVHVVIDLDVLRARLRQAFPDATLQLAQLGEDVVVEGQARDTRQVAQIIGIITGFLESIQTVRSKGGGGSSPIDPQAAPREQPAPQPVPNGDNGREDAAGRDSESRPQAEVLGEEGSRSFEVTVRRSQVINLIRVPGPQQILLKVRVAELNRTALRQLGVSALFQNGTGAIGTTIGTPLPSGGGVGGGAGATAVGGLLGLLDPVSAATGATVFGVFDKGNVNFFINALRRNQVLTILAEPNLVCLHGHTASFFSGGEFPVPVPQPSGGTGVSVVTIEYKKFGVSLDFVPHILDGDTIRLSVAPEVSSIDFSTGVVIQGTAVPGIATRRTNTVVELHEGQTLAIAGILQVEMSGTTDRIPGLGDLPYIGAMFRNNSTQSVEKELVILVTPYLVHPMEPDQVGPLPGEDVREPDDVEFFLKGRIESRVSRPYRATSGWDDPLKVEKRRQLEQRYVIGPYGYSQ